MASIPRTGASEDDERYHDAFIDAAEEAELEHGAARNLFDLRTIIGGLFTFYGVFLIILGVFDSQAEIDKAAGVRINLWTGLGMLALGLAFLAWALLRPLTLETIVEGQAESADTDAEHEELIGERRPRPPAH
jgi:hypothetical protein